MTETAPEAFSKICRRGPLSEAVITAVADAKGVDPLDLGPLYDVIDPDALNQILPRSVGRPPISLKVSFTMEGCEVVVHEDGEVIVTPPPAGDTSPTTVAPRED